MATFATLSLVLSAAFPGSSFGAKPGGGGTGTSCALVPQLTELSIGQGLPYPVLVRGKEILARAFLSRPQCSDSDDIIDITAAALTMTGGGATTSVGPTPTITTTYPQLAPYSSAPAQDAAGDPKFVIPAAATMAASTADRYTASFSLRIDYRSRTTSTATPVSGFVSFPLPNQAAPTATVEKRTAALRVLVQPLGDPTQAYSTWFTDADRATMQNAMTTLSRIFPVPNGTGDLAGTTGGVRYTINPTLLDIRALLGGDGKWCGTELNWTSIKAIMAQHLLSWNTANPTATADVIVGSVSSTKSGGGSAGCAEAMSIPGAPQMWVRSIPDANRAPSISGALTVMEMAHYLRVVPETRDAFGDAFHSPYTAADTTSPNRGYNVFSRSYLADDRSVMLLTGAGWHNTTTLLERDDFAAILCQLGGAATVDCGVSGTVGTTTGVGAGPRFVMSGRTNGMAAGTVVVESYFTSNVAPTQPDPASTYRLRQFQGSTLLRDDGVPVIFAQSEHGATDDASPAAVGIFAISLPASTAANRIQLVKDGVVLYERTGTVPPQIVSTTRVQSGEIVNYTDDSSRDDTDPALTNDGKWVAWEAPVGDFYYVHVAPASDVGEALPLGPPGDPIQSLDPAWCGDGSALAYVGPGGSIYSISVDARGPGIDFGDPVLVYDADDIDTGGPDASHPTWSPDCSEIVFEASSDIWKINAGGSETGLAALTTDNRSHDPTWSQTLGDDRIAYQREAFYYEIGMVDEIVLASHPGTGTQFTVNSTNDVNDGTCDATHCSLREAINAANALAGKNSIHFVIGTGPQTIQPTSGLPQVTSPLVIDGTTQPGWLDAPIIEIDGTATDNTVAAGLYVTAGDSVIRGLVINRFVNRAILLEIGDNNVIAGNYVGTDAAGTTSLPGLAFGAIEMRSGSNTNTLGGTATGDRNIVRHFVVIRDTTGHMIQGNYLGINAAGTGALGGFAGLVINNASNILIGGGVAGARNVISGSSSTGITASGASSTGIVIQGNYIGTTADGSADLGNGAAGVQLSGTGGGHTVGGTTPAERNVISGNASEGVIVDQDNIVQGNYVGTNALGTAAIPNDQYAINITGAGNTVGGLTAGARNLISGNLRGVRVSGASNVVHGNWFGLAADGTTPIVNDPSYLIELMGADNVVGGADPAARNVIVAKTHAFYVIANGNTIRNNWIGVDSTGAPETPGGAGIHVAGIANTIIRDNIVARHPSGGILVTTGSTGTLIRGNYIGTDAAGANLGNGFNGIALDAGSSGSTVGGSGAGDGNVIAFNAQNGVRVQSSGNTIRGNSIDGNGRLGIDLVAAGDPAAGVTVNDAGDADTGPNGLQNFPVVTSITPGGGGTDVAGTLNSAASTAYTVEVFWNPACDGSGFGEGETFLGRATTTTDASGNANWTVSSSTVIAPNDAVTATATDPGGSTSEFSSCLPTPADTATFTVNTVDDADDGSCTTYHCSLREAITQANATTNINGPDVIEFAITGSPPFVISPTSALPPITDPVEIDGTTQPGWVDAPVIEIDGSGAGDGVDGILVGLSGNGTKIRGLAVTGFSRDGIRIFGDVVVVEGSYIGLAPDGSTGRGNVGIGVQVLGGSGTRIGTAAFGIGTGNVISANGWHGISISGGTALDPVVDTVIGGNYIGTNAAGTAALGNVGYGVFLGSFAHTSLVGGGNSAERNVISANAFGVVLGIGATANTIRGNFIGTDATGAADLGNISTGIEINQGSNTTIGGIVFGQGNLISGNGTAISGANGIRIVGDQAVGNAIWGNLIGTDISGTLPLGNSDDGIEIDFEASQNVIGSTGTSNANTIAHNGADGIRIPAGTGNLIRGNAIYDNGGLGIDLGVDGVTPNDADDPDTGANGLQNFPVVTSAVSDGLSVTVTGTINSLPGTAQTIDVYGSAACDLSGNGEGAIWVGQAFVTTDSGGDSSFTASALTGVEPGDVITATASQDLSNNTSEFSACATITAEAESASWVVNTTDDNTDAFGCGTIHCSLREAILRANSTFGTDTITFDIPGAATPAAPHVIAVSSALPPISEAVVIDASTEPDFDTSTDAPVVQLDGTGVTNDPTYGLVLSAGSSTIVGFSITNFRDAGVRIESDGNALEGNYIGVEPDGVTAASNGWGPLSGYGVLVFEADGNAIGAADGIETAETNRNIISGNRGPGVAIFSGVTGATNNTVENNYIGTNASGTAALPNGVTGVVISDGEQNSIGGLNPGTGNVISGNDGDGITIIGDSDSGGTNFVQQNRIGTNAAGTAALPNDGPLATDGRGILIVNAPNNTIGGVNLISGDGAGNVISGNGTDGVEIQGALATTNYLTNNRIGLNAAGTAAISNGGAGIEILGGGGTGIGETTSGAANQISGNVGDGVSVLSGVGHEIIGNAIDGNGGLGIDLAPDGVTANDAGDGDTGANNRQNFPVIESASSDGATATISGYVEDVPAGTYDVHFYASSACDGSGNGEGGRYLGTTTAANEVAGDMNFTFATTDAVPGDVITASATDAGGNTSEFSACATVVGEADLSLTKTDNADPVTAGDNLTYTITVSNAGPSEATNVVVTDVLPDGVTYSDTESSASCSESGGTVTCTIASIASDGSDFVEVVVVPQLSATLTNQASAAADQVDPTPSNNSDTESTTVSPAVWEIWTLDPGAAADTQQRLISNGTQPSWGTDDQIAFTRSSGIWFVAGDGSGAVQVAGTGSADSASALGGRVLGFERTVADQQDVMLVREAEVITVTATVAQPDNARFDIFFDCGGPFFPMAVGLVPDSVTANTAMLAYTYDSSLACGSGTPNITAVVSDGVFRSDAAAAAARTEVTSEPKRPAVAIYSPTEGQTLLQFDVIAAHGWGKDPEDGQLADSRLTWTLTGPGGAVLESGPGHAVDFQPPNAGWTPSAVIGGVPQDDYAITLTGIDSAGNTSSRTHTFAILADADHDNLHAGIDRTDCTAGAGSGDNNASNAFADPDSDGIPSSDDRFTDGGVCTAEHDFSALVNFDPDEFNIPSTGQYATISIRVPYKSMSQVNGASVRITEIGGSPVSIANVGWSLKDGVGIAKFDRLTLAGYFSSAVNQRVTVVVEGSSKPIVSPAWSFEGIDSTYVKAGS